MNLSWPISRRFVTEPSQRESLLRQVGSVADVDLQLFENRSQIDRLIKFDSPPVIGEIGIFDGSFAMFLMRCYQPAEMHLFDLFRTGKKMGSADCDGNGFHTLTGDQLYQKNISLFGSDHRVTLHEGDSKATVRSMPNDHFDMIYVDGDHGYRGCFIDLLNCYEKVKHGGWIAGHDIAINPRKCQKNRKFGVKRAVLDFCDLKGLKINGLFNDGCVSYAIRVNKGSANSCGQSN